MRSGTAATGRRDVEIRTRVCAVSAQTARAPKAAGRNRSPLGRGSACRGKGRTALHAGHPCARPRGGCCLASAAYARVRGAAVPPRTRSVRTRVNGEEAGGAAFVPVSDGSPSRCRQTYRTISIRRRVHRCLAVLSSGRRTEGARAPRVERRPGRGLARGMPAFSAVAPGGGRPCRPADRNRVRPFVDGGDASGSGLRGDMPPQARRQAMSLQGRARRRRQAFALAAPTDALQSDCDQSGARLSMKAEMPSAVSRFSMFSTMTAPVSS